MRTIEPIKINITTLSNCLIGGAQQSYQIGGIDECTAINSNGEPIITASAFKGVTRNLFINESESSTSLDIIIDSYKKYFDYLIQEIDKSNSDEREKIKVELQNKRDEVSIKYLFGVEGYANSPKLMFSDLHVIKTKRCENKAEYFNVETKNTIIQDKQKDGRVIVSSNPRTYKTIKQDIVFEGEISFFKFNLFSNIGISDENIVLIKEFVKEHLKIFNHGIYRIGNSKSRGYGKIQLEIME